MTTSATPAGKPELLPFLLTVQQGAAACTPPRYVALLPLPLPLPGPDPQLLAVTVAVRAACGGVGNLTEADLPALGLGDPREAVVACCRRPPAGNRLRSFHAGRAQAPGGPSWRGDRRVGQQQTEGTS